jgi:hypothetical protein
MMPHLSVSKPEDRHTHSVRMPLFHNLAQHHALQGAAQRYDSVQFQIPSAADHHTPWRRSNKAAHLRNLWL